MATKIHALAEQGQSIWLDYITLDLIRSGNLKRLIDEDGLSGMTSNPTIFQKAIADGHSYDEQMKQLLSQGKTTLEIVDALIIKDIQDACDVFRPVYDATNGGNGFVSIEVLPRLAYDSDASLIEARRLWSAVNRPNLFVKIPGNMGGVGAIKQALIDGININITLLFSLRNHEQVMGAYIEALEARLAKQQPLDHLASVASFFVSRVDTAVDQELQSKIKAANNPEQAEQLKQLLGKAGIANAKLAYAAFQQTFGSTRFLKLQAHGARVQRPLWASTSTKNPAYRDVMYVESLIGPNTVNTVPQATFDAFKDHGVVRRTVDEHLDEARTIMQKLGEAGIDIDAVTSQLESDGISQFSKSYDELVADVEKKCAAMQQRVG